MVYRYARKGLPSLREQDAALMAQGVTPAEIADGYTDTQQGKGPLVQPQRDYMPPAVHPGDEVWVARPAVLAPNEDEALRFVMDCCDHGATICIAEPLTRLVVPRAAMPHVADALRLVALIAGDGPKAIMAKARRSRKPGKAGGKPKIPDDVIEAAKVHWFNHDIDADEAAAQAGVKSRTLARRLGPRGTPAFGAALNKRRGKS
jgi:hypothetical protein